MANFAHVPTAARRLVLEEARAIRRGAITRIGFGDRVGDDAFTDGIFEAAEDLAAEIRFATRMEIPPRALRRYLWRAARVGEQYAHCD
jgi:hypothetical protein